VRAYFRAEVRGLANMPPDGGVLLVSNHSGGMLTPDVPVFGPAFYNRFRLLAAAVHPGALCDLPGAVGPAAPASRRGPCQSRKCYARTAIGAVVLVFPGGDYDAYRPTAEQNVIDFDGRTGYARTAIEAGVPVVPMVSIGAQETQFFLARGTAAGEPAGPVPVPGGDRADQHRPAVRRDRHLPAELPAAVEDRDGGAGAGRPRVIRREPRCRRSRRSRPPRHAAGAQSPCPATTVPDPGLTVRAGDRSGSAAGLGAMVRAICSGGREANGSSLMM